MALSTRVINVLELQMQALRLDIQQQEGGATNGRKSNTQMVAETHAEEVEELITALKGLVARRATDDGGDGEGQKEGGETIYNASYIPPDDDPLRKCSICDNMRPCSQTYVALCNAIYCNACLSTLVENSLRDEALFPPRCCQQEIPLAPIADIIGPELSLRYDRKTILQKAANRIYHPMPTRSAPVLDTPEVSNGNEQQQIAESRSAPTLFLRECDICSTQHPASQTQVAPCGHIYCGDCLTGIFETGLTDEALLPARCCQQPIPLDSARRFLRPELARRVALKLIEHATVDRTYCHVQTCSTFILPYNTTGNCGHCTTCNADTCVRCKQPMHNSNCEQARNTALEQLADQQFVQLADQQAWQRCYQCNAVVELEVGCNHMR